MKNLMDLILHVNSYFGKKKKLFRHHNFVDNFNTTVLLVYTLTWGSHQTSTYNKQLCLLFLLQN